MVEWCKVGKFVRVLDGESGGDKNLDAKKERYLYGQ